MNAQDCAVMMAYVKASYPNAKIEEVTAEVYLRELGDVNASDAAEAVSMWVREQTWPPTIADIRHAAVAVRRRREVHVAPEPQSRRGYTPDATFLRERELAGIRRDVLKGLFRKEIWPEEWDDEPPTRPIVRAMP